MMTSKKVPVFPVLPYSSSNNNKYDYYYCYYYYYYYCCCCRCFNVMDCLCEWIVSPCKGYAPEQKDGVDNEAYQVLDEGRIGRIEPTTCIIGPRHEPATQRTRSRDELAAQRTRSRDQPTTYITGLRDEPVTKRTRSRDQPKTHITGSRDEPVIQRTRSRDQPATHITGSRDEPTTKRTRLRDQPTTYITGSRDDPAAHRTQSRVESSNLEPVKPRHKRAWLPKGLLNIGNTCYMNSVMQCLYYTTPLSQPLRHFKVGRTQGEVVKATVKVMNALHYRENPRKDVVWQLKRVVGQKNDEYSDFEQKEAHDFLCNMLEWLHEEMAQLQGKEETEDGGAVSLISDLFHGTHLSTVTCEEGPRTPVCSTDETFSNLSLTITRPTTLQAALEQYYAPQRLEWDCGNCGREHTCEHRVVLTKAPRVLVLHLNRSSNPDSSRFKVKVSYPAVLDHVKLDTGTSRQKYSLFAVCCHNGGMSGGHYSAYCRSDEHWYHFNDTTVTPTAAENVLDKPSAHILFYETNTMNHRA